MRRIALPIIIVVAGVCAALWAYRAGDVVPHYTGFVEGEERVLRSEVAGRLLEVRFREGDLVPAGEIVARLDASEIESRVASKRQEIAVADAEIAAQAERIALIESTWSREVSAREADVRQAESAAELAERTLRREQGLVATGASTRQLFDDVQSRRDQAYSGLDKVREVLARTRAEGRNVELGRLDLARLRERRGLAASQLAELLVLQGKTEIRSPNVVTRVQAQLLWPGELAQPGTPVLSVLDPADKYVQIYVPVADVDRTRVGTKVWVELDSTPGTRIAGEISFVAEKASFTPEKIETRSDRLGQVYRAKVRILERADELQPGTEGNVYLSEAA